MGVMEDSEQQQPSIVLKHYCRVCKRGFGCAGALGGHMRTHGVGGDSRGGVRHPNSGEDKYINDLSYNNSEGSKHSYFLRKANRFTSYRPSEDYDHCERPSSTRQGGNERGKCTMDEMLLPLSSSESEDEGIRVKSKRRRSEKYDDNYYASSEEEDLANCLVMLSHKSFVLSDNKEEKKAKEVEKGMFQCKACKKVFSSHQALGGHRASHKKVKGCYAARFTGNHTNEDHDNVEDDMISHDKLFVPSDSSEPGFDLDQSGQIPTSTSSKRKSKEHECSICHRIFSSGQALGGHKRCHWLTTNLPDNTIIQNLQDQFQFESPKLSKKSMVSKTENLDLNSPPLLDNAAFDHGNVNSPNTSPFKHDTPARIFLQLWGNEQAENSNHDQQGQMMHDSNSDEECRVKLAKLSDLKDMNGDGGSSGWLQVGIASTTENDSHPLR